MTVHTETETREFDLTIDGADFLRTLPADAQVHVEVPTDAGSFTGLDSVPYYGTVEDVLHDLEYTRKI